MIRAWSLIILLSISGARSLTSPCLGKEEAKLRYFFPQNDPYNITLAVTGKIENRWAERIDFNDMYLYICVFL